MGKRTVSADSASPFITEKDVILCRSGIQIYEGFEVEQFGLDMEGHSKDSYREYRPASVVIDAQDMMRKLPITKEHPSVWVDGDNWSELANGTTGDDVKIVTLDDGEIGVQSSLIFNTNKIYRYYKDGNKEVSLGYECEKRWATPEEAEEYGCDIILTKITAVNHLAVTAAGRGGSRVAIIDSVIGGLKMARTGIMFWSQHKDKAADAQFSFSKNLFDHLESGRGKTGKELEGEMSAVLDSISGAKDSESKDTLVGIVQDCFEFPDKALEAKEDIAKVADSCYISISGESMKEICGALGMGHGMHGEPDGDEGAVADAAKHSEPDGDEGKEGKDKDACASGKKPVDDNDGKGKTTSGVSDSAIASVVEKAVSEALGKSLDSRVEAIVRKTLGISGDGAKPELPGAQIDSNPAAEVDADAAQMLRECFA